MRPQRGGPQPKTRVSVIHALKGRKKDEDEVGAAFQQPPRMMSLMMKHGPLPDTYLWR